MVVYPSFIGRYLIHCLGLSSHSPTCIGDWWHIVGLVVSLLGCATAHSLARVVIGTWSHLFDLRGWTNCLTHIGCSCRQPALDLTHGIRWCWSVSFLDDGFGVFRWLWWLGYEFFNRLLILVLGLQAHSSLFTLQALDLYLLIDVAAALSGARNGSSHCPWVFLAGKFFLRSSVLNVDCQTLWG